MKHLILFSILILTASCQSQKKMKKQQKEIIQKYVKAYNEFDINGMSENLSEEVIFENMSDGKVDLKTEGLEAFKKQAESAKQYFSQRKQTIESWEFNDNEVIISIDYQAVLAIDLPNGMKAGEVLKLEGKSKFKFKDDKIVSLIDKS